MYNDFCIEADISLINSVRLNIIIICVFDLSDYFINLCSIKVERNANII